MKLRVKYGKERTSIDVNPEDTLQVLREKCQHLIPPSSVWSLSLNGTEVITSSDETKISQLGLVGGDLLHIMAEEGGGGGLKQQLLQMGFPEPHVDKVINAFGADTIGNAVELLSMLRESSGVQASVPLRTEAASKQQPPSSIEKMEVSTPETNRSTNQISRDVVTTNEVASANQSRYFKPLFLVDGITEELTSLVNGGNCETPADYLFLVVHTLMKETGLHLKNSTSQNTTSSSGQSRQDVSVVELPNDWRNTSMGFYRLNYEYKSRVSCTVTGTVTGKSMVVTGVVDIDDTDAHQVKLNVNEFVDMKSSSTPCNCASIYRNLNKLSMKMKNEIANKMIDDMRKELSLERSVVCLASLPEEIKLRLLCYLNPQTICRLSQVAREWKGLCVNNKIWRRMLFTDFGQRYESSCYRAYKGRTLERKELQRREAEYLRRFPLIPEFDIGMPDLLFPQAHPQVPGMIGGRHDLYPGDFPEIRRPRNDPLRAGPPMNPNQPGRVPGARFDPYGPIQDDGDDFGGRPIHPDALQRPQFGRGNGFGGGGGGFGGFM